MGGGVSLCGSGVWGNWACRGGKELEMRVKD